MDANKKYIKYIEKCIGDVCPYEEKNLQLLYHIGFMQAILAKLMLNDNKNFYTFKEVIEELQNGSKK